jgi:hypothetical protein
VVWCCGGAVAGFFSEMFTVTLLLFIHSMLYTVLFLELPACRRGEVSLEAPRSVAPIPPTLPRD